MSKIFERLILQRLLPILDQYNIILEHQFGFRRKHGTPEQCYRIVNEITDAFDRKMYCSAVFLDIRVWHILKNLLPALSCIHFKTKLVQSIQNHGNL